MRSIRPSRSWAAVSSFAFALATTVALPANSAAQGRRDASTGNTGTSSARGMAPDGASGRIAAGRFVQVRSKLEGCDYGDAECRVLLAKSSGPTPGLLTRGWDLQTLVTAQENGLFAFLCPCGKACLPWTDFGWLERNLHKGDVDVSFQGVGTNKYLTDKSKVEFRIKWSRSADGSGESLVSDEVVTFLSLPPKPRNPRLCR